jgi:3-methyladenine DNA glycosylase AlkD
LLRYKIPNERAVGIPMGDLKRYANRLGRSHGLALELWDTGLYEARTLAAFLDGLEFIARAEPDPRPLVKKAVDMALRGVGKRNRGLNAAAIEVAHQLAAEDARDRAWIGRHALAELTSEKVQKRLG